MGAKFSFVSQAHRRLAFQRDKKKKNNNAAAQELAAQEYARAMARIMTPAQMFQKLDVDETSIIYKWELLRFLRREAAVIQAMATAAHAQQSISFNAANEEEQAYAAEIMAKIKQIWTRLDKPSSLPVAVAPLSSAASGAGSSDKNSGSATARGVASSGTAAPAGSQTARANVTSPSPTSGGGTKDAKDKDKDKGGKDAKKGNATPVPSLNLSKAVEANGAGSLGSAGHSTAAAGSSVGSSGLDGSNIRDPAFQLTRDELVNLFRDFSNDDIEFIIRASLARDPILHPPIPSSSALNSRPSVTQTRFKDLFRWLFDVLDTERKAKLTGAQIRAWLVGPAPGVGGRSERNEMLTSRISPKVAAQTRVITNKLEETHLYSKPDFEYMFLRWTYEELLEVSAELRLEAENDIFAFQGSVREFQALTRRVDTVALATARGAERLEERRRMAILAATTQVVAPVVASPPPHRSHKRTASQLSTKSTTSAGGKESTTDLHSTLLPPASSGLDALTAGIAALLSEKDRRTAEELDRDRREAARAAELKKKEEKESADLEERRRRQLIEGEFQRSEERMKLLMKDLEKEAKATPEKRHAFVQAFLQLWRSSNPAPSAIPMSPTGNDGRFGSNELETLFKLQETYSISRRELVELCEEETNIPHVVDKINATLVASIPDLEPLCMYCLLHSSTYITRECGHICFCEKCANIVMNQPPHTRTCLVCKLPISQLIKCVWQHWITQKSWSQGLPSNIAGFQM